MQSLRKRFDEVDFMRALPLLFLPLVHCYEEFSWWGYLTEDALSKGEIFLYLCAFGPSIFMLVLGMNLAFSAHASAPELARRGVKTLIIAELLNLVRFVLPGIVLTCFGETWAFMDSLESASMSDILPFAGMAFLFFALMKKCKAKPETILLIALLLLSVHTLIAPADMESTVGTELLGNFVHATEDSSFPLLAWLVYPAVGYSMGLYMKTFQTEDDKRRFYRRLGVGSLVGLIALCTCMYSYDLDFLTIAAAPANDNITDLFNILLDLCIAGLFFGIMYSVYRAIRRKASPKMLEFITNVSKAIMVFYIIQWIFVGWMEYAMVSLEETYTLGVVEGVLLPGVAIMIISLLLALPIQKRVAVIKQKNRAIRDAKKAAKEAAKKASAK